MSEIIIKNNLSYLIQDKSVIMEYNQQFVVFNCYSQQSHKKFDKFKRDVINSSEDDLTTLPEAFRLAQKYSIGISGSKSSNIINNKISF